MQTALRSTPMAFRQLCKTSLNLGRQVTATRQLHVQVPTALTMSANKKLK